MIIAIYINLFVISFWHKASWGYIFFGIYHATLFVPIILRNIQAKDLELKWIHGWILHPVNALKAAGVYFLLTVAGILVPAKSFADVVGAIKGWFGPWGMPSSHDTFNIKIFVLCGLVVIIKDYLDELGAKHNIMKSNKPVWVVISMALFVLLIFFLRGDAPQEFIYKQF